MLQEKIANIYNVNMLLCVETIVDISNLLMAAASIVLMPSAWSISRRLWIWAMFMLRYT